MAKRLIIEGDEVVTRLLRESDARAVARASLTPDQRRDYKALRALAKDVARYRQPGGTSDHSDFYDENGLPI